MERERLCDSLRSQVGFYPFLPSLTVSFLPLIQPLVEKPSTRRKERNQRERLANPPLLTIPHWHLKGGKWMPMEW